jgi:hypothetical protein
MIPKELLTYNMKKYLKDYVPRLKASLYLEGWELCECKEISRNVIGDVDYPKIQLTVQMIGFPPTILY